MTFFFFFTQNVIAAGWVTANVEDVRVIGRDDNQSFLPCHRLANSHSFVKRNSFLQSHLCQVHMVTMVDTPTWSRAGQK